MSDVPKQDTSGSPEVLATGLANIKKFDWSTFNVIDRMFSQSNSKGFFFFHTQSGEMNPTTLGNLPSPVSAYTFCPHMKKYAMS